MDLNVTAARGLPRRDWTGPRGRSPAGQAEKADPAPQAASRSQADAEAAVTELYREHALGLVRLAHIMLGNPAAAEDMVQEAFCGLYRRWERLADTDKALWYVRSSVLNGCRSVLRRGRGPQLLDHLPDAVSAESAALIDEERQEVMQALRQLPYRQREALVLRFYFGHSGAEIARVMGISESTVRSTTHRGLAALGRMLGETR